MIKCANISPYMRRPLVIYSMTLQRLHSEFPYILSKFLSGAIRIDSKKSIKGTENVGCWERQDLPIIPKMSDNQGASRMQRPTENAVRCQERRFEGSQTAPSRFFLRLQILHSFCNILKSYLNSGQCYEGNFFLFSFYPSLQFHHTMQLFWYS